MFETILAGIDGSARTQPLVRLAAGLARLHSAQLRLLCAVDPGYDLPEPDGARPSVADEVDYPAAAIEREGVDALMRGLMAELRGQGMQASYSIEPGDPVEILLAEARAVPAPLIVLGHRHFSWAQKLLDRSVCLAVLEAAQCPVLVLPEGVA